ncbi:MAG: NADH-quinone oxidoreductase subunit C [Deltaproteobacteria bacterium]|nr:NADH-quinone oxidoreductase subunit C [Deltaproteobacteria bacterium]MBI4223922.1 NADH-quinone oxidoreductase subunit C [Deltaproteobacteria bacterium]
MKSLFTALPNGGSIPQSRLPLLEIELWRQTILEHCLKDQARIVALFGERGSDQRIRVYCLLGADHQKLLLAGAAELTPANPAYPSLTTHLPEAHLFERELHEEYQIVPEGHPWLKPVRRHGSYPYYRVEGDGIHEVAVGPVHAGIIEPGHFRFQCDGETVLHLEIQLGYQHRGVENLLVRAGRGRRAVLAESIAGDSVIGHGLAFCQALEGLAEICAVTKRAHGLRGIALELERLANHAGDLGALANDVGFLPASAYFGRLRGEFLNLLMELSGNRYGRSFVRPGGVLFDLPPGMTGDFQNRLKQALHEINELSGLLFETASVLARLESTGILPGGLAKELGLVGMAARASHLARDVRHDHPFGIYRWNPIHPVTLSTGDVFARAKIRSLECKQSLKYVLALLEALPAGKILEPCENLRPSSFSASLVEGWRGEIAHIVLTDATGGIARYKIVDPSFHNWPGLAMAMRGGQISDFPLCNKSFNLSYAGHDL